MLSSFFCFFGTPINPHSNSSILKNSELPVTNYTTSGGGTGVWSDGASWAGGVAPGTTLNNDVVTIVHPITYPDNLSDLEVNDGSRLAINGAGGNTGKLTLDEGVSIFFSKNGNGGELLMEEGELKIEGQSGNLDFGAASTAVVSAAKITVAGDWKSSSSTSNRSISGGCLIVTNGNFVNLGTDTYNGVCLEIFNEGWKNEGTVTVGPNGIAVHCTGSFDNVGVVNGTGDILAIDAAGQDIKNDTESNWSTSVNILAYCGNTPTGFPGGVVPGSANCTASGSYFSCTACDGAQNPLPVEFSSFTGYSEGEVNRLEWSTSAEQDNMAYMVERSVTGQQFKVIGQVAGNGNTSLESYYNFEDKLPLPHAYYRLKQVDFDGKYTYSPVIFIEREKFDIDLKVFPNIVDEEVTIRIHTLGVSQKAEKYILKIVSTEGQVKYEEQLRSPNILEYLKLPTSSYEPGMYYISLQNKNGLYSSKFVIQRD